MNFWTKPPWWHVPWQWLCLLYSTLIFEGWIIWPIVCCFSRILSTRSSHQWTVGICQPFASHPSPDRVSPLWNLLLLSFLWQECTLICYLRDIIEAAVSELQNTSRLDWGLAIDSETSISVVWKFTQQKPKCPVGLEYLPLYLASILW